ncbi:hypothetical protein [Aeromonas veronii]|uniref:hypothetical protein n=1 Tax=Aeromonas veronii TaxID=654 RepID=UPI00191D5541|nr:hypothetical protein [Aeromonas veronii]MBL0567250.1 hypothetical protein [Aeromonas veronii]
METQLLVNCRAFDGRSLNSTVAYWHFLLLILIAAVLFTYSGNLLCQQLTKYANLRCCAVRFLPSDYDPFIEAAVDLSSNDRNGHVKSDRPINKGDVIGFIQISFY